MGWTKRGVRNTGHPSYAAIKDNIPEFNSGFFGCNPLLTGLDFWWDNRLTEPRIKAFNDLIKLYSCDERKDIPFIWNKKL